MNTKAIKHILTFLFAAYFLLVGVGYNVVNYCCNSCADEGIETIATSSCNAVHEHSPKMNTHHSSDDIACNNINHSPNGCHLLRLNIDTPSFNGNSQITVPSVFSFDLFFSTLNLMLGNNKHTFLETISPPNRQFRANGREIITFHAVLLI